MTPNKEEHKKTQLKIIEFLFKQDKSTHFDTLCELIKQSKNETQYHIERLREQSLIKNVSKSMGGVSWTEFEISEKGRKFVMEGESQDDSQ